MSVLRRANWRCRLRQDWASGQAEGKAAVWAHKLGISEQNYLAALGRHPYFGAFWAEVEAQSPRLQWRLVTMAGLKRELRRIRRLVDTARARDKAALAASPRTVKAA